MSQYTLISKQPGLYTPMQSLEEVHATLDEKRQPPCACQTESPMQSHHDPCHNHRLRRFLAPALGVLLSIVAILAFVSCSGGFGMSSLDAGALVARAATNPNESPFTKHKLYLVVIFVGLLVVIILAIMLSAWCCKGSFENPLCCPCYLCACCGGLACLECIGCGLCCEGVQELSE